MINQNEKYECISTVSTVHIDGCFCASVSSLNAILYSPGPVASKSVPSWSWQPHGAVTPSRSE